MTESKISTGIKFKTIATSVNCNKTATDRWGYWNASSRVSLSEQIPDDAKIISIFPQFCHKSDDLNVIGLLDVEYREEYRDISFHVNSSFSETFYVGALVVYR